MAQEKLIELASLGFDQTNIDVSDGYVTHCKSSSNSAIQGEKENNVLLSQGITSDDNEDIIAGAATALSLLTATDTQAVRIISIVQ